MHLTDNAVIYLVGNGPEKEEMIATIKDCKLTNKVFILDGVDDKELNYLYKSKSILLTINYKS